MGTVATTSDPNWPSAATLLSERPVEGRRNVGLLGISTYATSVTARSATSTPAAIRSALERYSTWSYSEAIDLAEHVRLVDFGDVDSPDAAGGASASPTRSRDGTPASRCASSWAVTTRRRGSRCAPSAAATSRTSDCVTLDAHLDMRDGISNGSPVRQLLEEGLDPHHVVQVGLSDFANSPAYARRAHDAGVAVISRDHLHHEPIEEAAQRAVAIAGAGGRHVYVDIDMDAADRSRRTGLSGRGAGRPQRRRDAAIRPSRGAAARRLARSISPRSTSNEIAPTSERFASPRSWYSRRSRAREGDCNGRRTSASSHSRANSWSRSRADFETVTLSDAVVARLERQRAAIDALVESGTPVYGLSTGFGSLATTFISPEERRDLQRSLIRSHAAGVGPEVENEVVRAMMVSRLDEPLQRRLGRSTRDGRGLRRAAQRRHHAGRPRVRLARVLGRPRPAGPRGARPDGRG